MSVNQWDTLYRKAKALEAKLENKVQKYSSIAQRINADFLCDEENPFIESKEERELAADIENDLNQLSECIGRMKTCKSASSAQQQEVLIRRYHEIHFDYSSEFRNTAATVHRKRESMELFHSSNTNQSEDQDPSTEKLLRERSSIAASMKSIEGVISQAFETSNSLSNQRSRLTAATGGLTGLVANVPSFQRLIDGIQKKKYRESLVIVIVFSLLLCFCIWWVFLR